jgi:tRNA modification GTPase
VRLQRSAVAASFKHVIEISARRNRNIRLLEDEIFRVIMKDRLHASEPAFVSSGRQIEELSGARRLIVRAVRSLGEDASLECAAQDIQEAIGSLDDVLGKRFTHDVLDRIFNMFCVGK